MNYKYITTTLPYINSVPHIGHCFEFVLADTISDFYRKQGFETFLNIGVDENGQKIYQKSIQDGYTNTQDYCDKLALTWKNFCKEFNINYDNFYRTTDKNHKENVIRFYNDIKNFTYSKSYKGKYCIGCESFKTEKEIVDNKCTIHNQELIELEEDNIFFDLNRFSNEIKNILIDNSLSTELNNTINDKFDFSITRKNVDWGIKTENGDTFYCWFEALCNYIFAIKFYEDREFFNKYWKNSLQICVKDNLKFQAYILQALLLANNIPQTKELLVHGLILDDKGNKMSKSDNNIIDPIDQKNKYGLTQLRYYLLTGLNTFSNSKYSESDLISLWNNDIVNGYGNLISRTLHLIDIKNVDVSNFDSLSENYKNKIIIQNQNIDVLFEKYNFQNIRNYLNNVIFKLNKRIQDDKPYSKECINAEEILKEIYFELKYISKYYRILLKEYDEIIAEAFEINKKVILFEKLEKY